MSKIMVPYQGCKLSDVTQIFGVNPNSYQPKGHTGVDFAFSRCYGKFLVAPARCLVKKIVTDETINSDYYPALERGYGITLQNADDPAIQYLYWHTMQVFPVTVGQVVQQGEIVAQIGNSGMCYQGGKLVPVNDRGTGKGSHLHYEKHVNGVHVTVLPDIDFTLQPKINSIKAVQQILTRMTNLILKRK